MKTYPVKWHHADVGTAHCIKLASQLPKVWTSNHIASFLCLIWKQKLISILKKISIRCTELANVNRLPVSNTSETFLQQGYMTCQECKECSWVYAGFWENGRNFAEYETYAFNVTVFPISIPCVCLFNPPMNANNWKLGKDNWERTKIPHIPSFHPNQKCNGLHFTGQRHTWSRPVVFRSVHELLRISDNES